VHLLNAFGAATHACLFAPFLEFGKSSFAGQDSLQKSGSNARARVGTGLEAVKRAHIAQVSGVCAW
jgi:hypothetical protein